MAVIELLVAPADDPALLDATTVNVYDVADANPSNVYDVFVVVLVVVAGVDVIV